MRRIASFVLCSTLIAGAGAQQKKRVAVMNFDYATVQSGVAALFGTNQDIGKGIADILVDKLVNGGAYSVIERKQLDKILAEQNFSNSDRADANSAAKIARILGVDAIIVGSITQFGRDDKSTAVGGGAATSALGRFGIGGVKSTKSTAVCQITARMINTSTAEILASVQGRGEESRNGTGILGAGGSYAGMAAGALDMKSSNFADTIIGEATMDAVDKLALQIRTVNLSGGATDKSIDVDARVADVNGTSITINAGSAAGLQVGQTFTLFHKGKEIKDPSTGEVLDVQTTALGQLTLTSVRERVSTGTYSGTAVPVVGDVVRK